VEFARRDHFAQQFARTQEMFLAGELSQIPGAHPFRQWLSDPWWLRGWRAEEIHGGMLPQFRGEIVAERRAAFVGGL
jgi:hypothetical protein